METEFTPWLSLSGGAMIGASAVLLMATNGRIAGISGLTSRLFARDSDGEARGVSFFFVLGLLLAAPLWLITSGGWPQQWVPSNPVLMAVAGLLVGFGATYGNGCTSGHGVCGISRGSARSIVATVTFMATAFVTVFVMRHVIGG
ncbi:YeeE/YedE family protein [Sulfitobacter sp. KE34]|uniref:YeeE/YedE family protein n=1 Tax=Sulfitobacter faviae TaxID=1775881 RepID=A0AAX3LQW5_9RHOB|nr:MULTISPECIES: YeeE/YedE family protein [Sulfitobacter]MDF3350998.1 YeeE/YedE family protein [Sulfitobacter sp. KE12]MDF3354670.1 YeeE/YedE family protein [Sulfitobacter sp. KE27]MDF3358318.1 YeeE/YedE family protein [Sulfitobacter sp. KE33]MDF3361136.1 YeeE/YedE family protein [Sulfitobacter sp. Ks41]MDF3365742.1 YeeE/YedE family protein [Sulfitobacter sp. Ks34]